MTSIQEDKTFGEIFPDIDVELSFNVEFGGYSDLNVFCPYHEDETTSRTKSCSVSVLGIFNCKVCKSKGTATQFYAKVHKLSLEEANRLLSQHTDTPEYKRRRAKQRHYRTEKSQALAKSNLDKRCVEDFTSSDKYYRYLTKRRGLSNEIIREHLIGRDEHRITIPVYDAEGVLVNIRRYLPNAASSPKMLTHHMGSGTPILYPYPPLIALVDSTDIILCEGEWDCLLLRSLGFQAFTNTGNVSAWATDWIDDLRHHSITIIFDVNDKDADLGQRIAWDRAQLLYDAGAEVKVVRLPIDDVGGDITDYFLKYKNTANDLQTLIDNTSWVTAKTFERPKEQITKNEPSPRRHGPYDVDTNDYTELIMNTPIITLHDAADSEYAFQSINLRCLVAGKGMAPYIVPKKITLEIRDKKGQRTVQREFESWDSIVLKMVGCTDAAQLYVIRKELEIPKNASVTMIVDESMNVEEIYLIPTVDETDEEQGAYTMRQAYYVGHGIETNRVYEFFGYTLPHPKTQQATHILIKANPAESTLDSFKMTSKLYKQLAKVFQSKDTLAKLDDIAEHLSQHVTKIYGRNDLHTAVDLVFHSPLSYDFDNNRLRKGWLELLVIGDTRTGKGFVTEGLVRHFGLGEVISSENMTMAGLVGAVQKLGDRWTLVWGKLPLSDRRLIVLDECGSLSYNDIARMSRIRSEGIAEITKVVTEKTTSRTRLIWLANPRPPQGIHAARVIADYNYGIEAVSGLIGAPEDVARFDLALVVAKDEVSSKDINQRRKKTKIDNPYSAELCHQLVLWVWSRKPEHIVFKVDIVEQIMRAALSLGKQFSSRVCLIQSEDVRFKLVRIATAAAARTFSTDDKGEKVIVTKEHVTFAYNFLIHIYSKASSGYEQLSRLDRENSTLRDEGDIKEILEGTGEQLEDLVHGLLDHRLLTAHDMSDYTGCDFHEAKDIISGLVRARAIVKEHNGYVKKPAFRVFLNKLKAELTQDQTTQPETA